MRNRSANDDDMPGQDSFLDIVANIVGILIILVTVVGVRASHAPPKELRETNGDSPTVRCGPAEDGHPHSDADLKSQAESLAALDLQIAAEVDQIASLQSSVQKLAQRVVNAEQEEIRRDEERTRMQAIVNVAREDVETKRKSLDANRHKEFELQQNLSGSQSRLEELSREQFALETASPDVETIESLPTPLAQTVLGDEIHVRLRRGRVAVVPLDALLDLVKQDAEAKVSRLENRKSLVETVGPVDGFRLRYRLVRKVYSMPSGGGMQHGTIVSLDRWELLPVVDDLGVPVEQALLPGGKLHMALGGASHDRTTVTIWTYPDSFAEFRTLKRTLFDLGYSAAGRPLPSGIRIGGSPQGTKSSAQ